MTKLTTDTIELIDSHAHIDMPDFDSDREAVIARAANNQVVCILCPGDLTSSKSLAVVKKFREKSPAVIFSAGVHPHQAKLFSGDHLRTMEFLAQTESIKAVGEIGLDYFYNFSQKTEQMEAFRAQLHAARTLKLPVIIHSRKAGNDVVQAVCSEDANCGGIMHSYTEDWDVASKMIDIGFYISFSGILTLPGAHNVREVARKVPLDRILVETDSPYLIPASLKGKAKRNEPAFVRETAMMLAELRGLSFMEIARQTTLNFRKIFRFEKN